MDRATIEKNRLDLAYQRRMQQQNVVLAFMTTSIFSFVISIIFGKEERTVGILLAICLLVISIMLYQKLDRDLHSISNQISSLK